MPRVELRVESVRDRYAVYRAFNPNTGIVEERPAIPALRLIVTVLVGKDPTPGSPDNRANLDMLLDTGAPLSIIPYRNWCTWPVGTIEWLELCEGVTEFIRPIGRQLTDPPISFGTRNQTVGGGTHRCWLGRVWLGVIDAEFRSLPAVSVTSWFVADPNNDRSQPLLGLHCGILDGRRLLRNTDPDAPNGFLQDWILEV